MHLSMCAWMTHIQADDYLCISYHCSLGDNKIGLVAMKAIADLLQQNKSLEDLR